MVPEHSRTLHDAAGDRTSPRKAALVGNRSGTHRHEAFWAIGAVLAVTFVVLVAYLPHMPTQVGMRADADGNDPARTDAPWPRFVNAYADWWTGEEGADDYPYPLHVDSNVHWVNMATIQRADSLRHPDPYGLTQEQDVPLSLKGLIHETGFRTAFVVLQDLTGVPWLQLIRFAPAAFAGLTAAFVTMSLRGSPAGPIAGALVALVPTTPRFLGPGFFVPVGLGLAWLAATLLILRQDLRRPSQRILLAMLVTWSFFIHLIIGFGAVLIVVAGLAASARDIRRSLLRAGWLLIPLVALYDAFESDFADETNKLGFLPIDFTVFDHLGIPFLLLWALGASLVVLRPAPPRVRPVVNAATVGSGVALALIVSNVALELNRYAFYDRWHPVFALLATIPVAHGLVAIWQEAATAVTRWARTRRRERLPMSFLRQPVIGFAAAGMALVLISTPGLEAHLDEQYYHILTDEDWALFQAAADIGDEYDIFLAHPWKAPVFTAISGKRPATWLDPGRPPVNVEVAIAYEQGGFFDAAWIVEQEISMVLTAPFPTTDAFYAHESGAYLLREEYARELHHILELKRAAVS